MTPLELILCVALVLFSAFLSGSEIALFSLSRFQLRMLKDRARGAHRRIKRLLSDSGGLLVTILVFNEMVNITLSTQVAKMIARSGWGELRLFGQSIGSKAMVETALEILITTPIILLICEISPKVIAARANYLIAPLAVGPLELVYRAAMPLRKLLKRFVRSISGQKAPEIPIEGESRRGKVLVSENDFMLMLEEGHKEGAIQGTELELIRNVFELDDTAVEEVATPLSQCYALTEHTTLKTALGSIRSMPSQPRIPVLSHGRKQVVGVLYSKDLLKAKLEPELLNLTVTAIMRKPLFVNPAVRLNALFRRMKQQRMHIAVVQDGGNGPALGIVTMSDILDTLFEDVLPDPRYEAEEEDDEQEETEEALEQPPAPSGRAGRAGKKAKR